MRWTNQIKYSMRTNWGYIILFSFAVIFSSCKDDSDFETPIVENKTSGDEFDGIEVLFNEKEFPNAKCVDLLKEINICSDAQVDADGQLMTPCSTELFKFFQLRDDLPLEDGFILLVKANTGGIPLRRVLVFEREAGTLVKVNGFIGNLIGKKKSKDSNDDLLLRFIDKIEGSDVYYHCIFKWENGQYVFKTVEVIQEPAGNFSGIVKASVKDSVSQEIFKILMDNQMIF